MVRMSPCRTVLQTGRNTETHENGRDERVDLPLLTEAQTQLVFALETPGACGSGLWEDPDRHCLPMVGGNISSLCMQRVKLCIQRRKLALWSKTSPMCFPQRVTPKIQVLLSCYLIFQSKNSSSSVRKRNEVEKSLFRLGLCHSPHTLAHFLRV